MNEAEIKTMVAEVLTQVAPNIDAGALDPEVAFRDQVEFDSLDFLNFVIALGERSGAEISEIDYPKLALGNRKCEHGVILKIVATNICGSDQHMVRGRTTAPAGLILGHEITGEIVEAGRDVEFLSVGDIVSVPFNIACGRCRNCKEGKTGICLNVNPARRLRVNWESTSWS